MVAKYKVDEKVLCYHGPLLYEAKCTKIKKDGNSHQFFIHYQGWNKNWDEWVTEDRMLKQNTENIEKQKKLLASHMAQAKANKKLKKEIKKGTKGGSDSNSNSRASTPVSDRTERTVDTPRLDRAATAAATAAASGGSEKSDRLDRAAERSTPAVARGNKRSVTEDDRSTSSRDEEGPTSSSKEIAAKKIKKKKETILQPVFADEVPGVKVNVELPIELRYILCRDWDNVVNRKKLFKIPAKVTVTHILEQYISHLSTTETKLYKKSIAAEVIRGFGEYFNVALGSQLLYGLEKLQYKEDCETKGAIQPCDIYGSAHLLRLMVKVGEYISAGSFSDQNIKVIEEQLEDFLTYLDTNKSMFFQKKSYHKVSADYVSKNNKLLLSGKS